jgi:ATP-dependent exoDNAse (exonuclease V) alpha subunit
MTSQNEITEGPNGPVNHYRQLLMQPGIGEVTAYRTVIDTDKWWTADRETARTLCIEAGLTKLASLLVAECFVIGGASGKANAPLVTVRMPDGTTASCALNPWAIIRRVPRYTLTDADAIATLTGLPLTSPDRLAEVAWHALLGTLNDWSNSGDVHVAPTAVRKRFGELVADVPEVPDDAWTVALDDLRKDDRIASADILTARSGMTPRTVERMTTATLYNAERVIAERAFSHDLYGMVLEGFRINDTGILDPGQKAAVMQAFESGFSIVDAPPGYGKTYVIAMIAAVAHRLHIPIAVGTFMGRAASRVADELRHHNIPVDVVEYGPGTLHSLLKIDPDETSSVALRNAAQNGIFIVDEASMLPSSLLSMVMRGVPAGWNIILFGDARQLPPISAGSPYIDLIKSGVIPVGELTKCWRTDQPDIQSALASIRNGQTPESSENFQIIITERDDAVRTVVATIRQLAKDVKCNPLEILVAAPQANTIKRVDMIKVNDLNRGLKVAFNPKAPRGQWWIPATGDRVMARDPRGGKSSLSANAAHKDAVTGEQRAYNGELGTILEVGKDRGFIAWDSDQDNPKAYTIGELTSDQRIVDLAYAVTVHRVQGAEAPAIVFVVDSNCTPVTLTNAHAYTACSRGKLKVAVVTTIARPFNRTGFTSAINRPLKMRQTLLSQFLTEDPKEWRDEDD